MVGLIMGIAIILILLLVGIIAMADTIGDWTLIVVPIVGSIGIALILNYQNSIPTALDVYKDRTELRITYDGKIPVDSVVIYKKGGEK